MTHEPARPVRPLMRHDLDALVAAARLACGCTCAPASTSVTDRAGVHRLTLEHQPGCAALPDEPPSAGGSATTRPRRPRLRVVPEEPSK